MGIQTFTRLWCDGKKGRCRSWCDATDEEYSMWCRGVLKDEESPAWNYALCPDCYHDVKSDYNKELDGYIIYTKPGPSLQPSAINLTLVVCLLARR